MGLNSVWPAAAAWRWCSRRLNAVLSEHGQSVESKQLHFNSESELDMLNELHSVHNRYIALKVRPIEIALFPTSMIVTTHKSLSCKQFGNHSSTVTSEQMSFGSSVYPIQLIWLRQQGIKQVEKHVRAQAKKNTWMPC